MKRNSNEFKTFHQQRKNTHEFSIKKRHKTSVDLFG